MKRMIISTLILSLISSYVFSLITMVITQEFPANPNGNHTAIPKEITYYNDDKEIAKEIYDKNGILLVEEGKIPDGLVIQYSENGKLNAAMNYKSGRKTGLTKLYYENGKLKADLNYKNNNLEGLCKDYFESGNIKTEWNVQNGITINIQHYKDVSIKQEDNPNVKTTANSNGNIVLNPIKYVGVQNLTSRAVLENQNNIEKYPGIIREDLTFFSNEKKIAQKSYNQQDGTIVTMGEIPNGVVKEYYTSGKLKFETYYLNNKENGLSKEYYENGNMKTEVNYSDDKKNGLEKDYSFNGVLFNQETFKDGALSDSKIAGQKMEAQKLSFKIVYVYQKGCAACENEKNMIEGFKDKFNGTCNLIEYEIGQNSKEAAEYNIKIENKAPSVYSSTFYPAGTHPQPVLTHPLPAVIVFDANEKELYRTTQVISANQLSTEIDHAGVRVVPIDQLKNITISKGPIIKGKSKVMIFSTPTEHIIITVMIKDNIIKEIDTKRSVIFWDLKDNKGTYVDCGDYTIVIEDTKNNRKEIPVTVLNEIKDTK